MPVTYALGPIPFWQFTDATSKLTIFGALFTYTASDHDVKKPIYRDIAGVSPYPNPAQMNGVGGIGPIYWSDDEAYYVEFRKTTDPGSDLIWSVDNYVPGAGGGGGTITVNQDFENYVNNAQFRFQFPLTASPLPIGPFKIAQDNWYFRKNNTSANDAYTFEAINPVSPGATLPDPNALYYLKYSVTNSPTGESDKVFAYRWPDVRTFQGQPVTVSFKVRATGAMISTCEIVMRQHFGTGGTPSADVLEAKVAVPCDGTWQQQQHTFTVNPLTGKVIGDNGDDYIEIGIQPPLNAQGDFEFDNFQLQLGQVTSPNFTFQSKADTEGDLNLKVLVSETDQESQVLEQKLVAGSGIAITKQTAANIETLEFSSGGAAQFLFGKNTSTTTITGGFNGTGSFPHASTNLVASVTVTPASVSSVMEITGLMQNIFQTQVSSGTYWVTAGIFRSSDTYARSAARQICFVRFAGVADVDFQTSSTLPIEFCEVSGTVSPITYELRVAANVASSASFNNPNYGSSSACWIKVTEHI